jgi:hypothetical protein
MCRSRKEAKIHPRPRRGCKVCFQPGSHIGPAVAAGRETRRGETRTLSADAARVPLAGALCEATRRSHRQRQPGMRERGATRELTVGNAGRCAVRAIAGALRGVAEAEMRGNPEIHRLRCRRIGESRRLEAPSPVQRKNAGCEEARECIGKLNGTMFDPSNL